MRCAAAGYSRGTTPHLGGDRALTDRITMTYYDAGHMMYIHLPSLRKLKEDIARFMANS
jgi:carboxypeptidase C (cathepsin A)